MVFNMVGGGGGIEVNGVEHTYRLAPNSTIHKGDLCLYGSVGQAASYIRAVYPDGYQYTGGMGSPCVALETKTAGDISETVNINVLAVN